jgi:penicillin-binding protein 1A
VGEARKISLRQALAQSNNEASVAILRESGPEQVVQWAHALGIASTMQPDLSLALGAYEVTPLELANAYATLASGGMFAEPVALLGVSGPDGAAVQLAQLPPARRVLSEEEAYLTTSLMRSVIREGTGAAAAKLGRELAGKTGTTNESKDAWFAGFSTDVVAVVWVGYDDAHSLGKRESGARTALPAWIQFMEAAHRERPKTEFTRPDGILQLKVDKRSGLLPNSPDSETLVEEFMAGTEPTEVAPLDADAGAPEPPDALPPTGSAVDDELPEPPPF